MFGERHPVDDELDRLLRSACPDPPDLDPEEADAIFRSALRQYRRSRPAGAGWRFFAWGAAASIALGAATATALVQPGTGPARVVPGDAAARAPEVTEPPKQLVKRTPPAELPVVRKSIRATPPRRKPASARPRVRKPVRPKRAVVLAQSEPIAPEPPRQPVTDSRDLLLAKADLELARRVEEVRREQALALAPRLLVTAVPPGDGGESETAVHGCDPQYARAAALQADPLGGVTRTEVTVTPDRPEPEVNRVALRPWWSMGW
ncbi:MAG: hypothetical protein ACK47B_12305 [Armatimonadota bacterium]